MKLYPRLKPIVLLILITGALNSDAVGQQITPEGFVDVDGQQATTDLGPTANFGDVRLGDPFFDTFASGRLTVSEGALLNANLIQVGSDLSTGVLEAQGFGTSVISQNIDLVSGAISVTDGAAVNGSSLDVPPNNSFAPTINVSGLGSLLSLGQVFLDRGTLNISDAGNFFAFTLDLGANGFPVGTARINLTNGGQAVIDNLDFGSQGFSEISIGDNSFLSVLSGFTIGGNNTITLDGGQLIANQSFFGIGGAGELRGYGDVIGQIQLEGSPLDDQRLTVTADQTLRTSEIINFTGQITNFGTLDAGNNVIQNAFNGRYLGENSTIRASILFNDGTINLTQGRNFVEANLENFGDFNISGGASVIFTDEVFNNGVVHTEDGSTSTLLGRLCGSGVFEGEGDVTILSEFAPGNSPGLVSFESDLAFGAGATTEIELAGTLRSTAMQTSALDRFDAFDVGGTLTLGGDLEIALLDGFDVESGQEFIIADVDDALVGQFNGLDEGAMVGNFGGTDLFISYVAGDGNDVALFTAAASEIFLGDANQDGVVDFSDIPAFIAILLAGDFLEEADVNQDDVVDFADIPPFIEILIGG